MLYSFLNPMIRVGRLTLHLPHGKTLIFGETAGPLHGPEVTVRFRKPWTALKIGIDPDLNFGQAYMDGDITLEQGDIWDLMELIGVNLANRQARPADKVVDAALRLLLPLSHSIGRLAARRNVAHHYDLSEELYRRFLDADMQYSCAYFSDPDMTLEAAQAAKKRHIIAKLLLQPGQQVLDIGSGWGGLAMSIAQSCDVKVTGVTLSTEQLRVAQDRAEAAGLSDRVTFKLCDYRELGGRFDRIVSVGMFEHVGRADHRTYFNTVHDLLTEDGVALVHAIGRCTPPQPVKGFVSKYIFPGGYIPALSEVTRAIEGSRLWLGDMEILRLHYAETLKHWRLRFWKARDEIKAMYDERFCRMWEFYLVMCEAGFRYADMMVFQAQVSRKVGAIPITRDYVTEAEYGAPERRIAAE